MKLAFCIFRVFPHGGLSRDFMRIAAACAKRGHDVRAYARRWDAPAPDSIEMVAVPARGATNPARNRRFARWVSDDLERRPADLVVGFNKMPGLDVYFAGDSCFEEKMQTQRPWAYRLLPRYRHFAEFERAVFGDERQVKILTIVPSQRAAFQGHYGTVDTRFFTLPPDVGPTATPDGFRGSTLPATGETPAIPDASAAGEASPAEGSDARRRLRQEFQLSEDDLALLFVGSGFVTKGLDRLLVAVASLPDSLGSRVHLFVVGEDRQRRFARRAARLGITDQVRFLGGRDDVSRFLHGSDALALPAYGEAGGLVILEAIAAGLPVLATEVCGHAFHISKANAGIVSPSPFDQTRFNSAVCEILTSPKRSAWRENGQRYAASGALSGGTRTACELIESFGKREPRPVVAFCLHRFAAAEPVSRDCIRVANACRAAGYHPRIYAMTQESTPGDFEVFVCPMASMSDHTKVERFERWVARHLRRNPVHCVVGFKKMPGLDIYVATEPCAQRELDREATRIGISEPIRLRDVFPWGSAARTRQTLASEHAVFDGTTKILMTNASQRDDYADYYDIERSIEERSSDGDSESVMALITQTVDSRIQPSMEQTYPGGVSDPKRLFHGRRAGPGHRRRRRRRQWGTAGDLATTTPPVDLRTSESDHYLRDDLKSAWAGRDPFDVVRELQGDTYRVVKNRRTLRFVEGGAPYFAKVHDAVGWAEILKELCNLKLPPVGALNEYAACRFLEARRIRAPRVAAFGRRGLNPARARSFVVCDALDGYVSLEDLTDAWPAAPPDAARKRRLVHAVADLARRLHGAGVNHRDFYICHIWAKTDALSRDEVELAIIDLHRAQIRPRVPRRWILRDLAALMFSTAHLGLSRNDYLRFLKRYTRRPLRDVLRKEAALLRRIRRRADRLVAESRTRDVIGTHRRPAFEVRGQT